MIAVLTTYDGFVKSMEIAAPHHSICIPIHPKSTRLLLEHKVSAKDIRPSVAIYYYNFRLQNIVGSTAYYYEEQPYIY